MEFYGTGLISALSEEYGYPAVSLLCSLIGAYRCRSLGMGTENYPCGIGGRIGA